jgi:hypothetical protein
MGTESNSPIANKLLNQDGSVTNFKGEILQEASITGEMDYQSRMPIANKFENPDGTIHTLDEIIGGGGGGIPEAPINGKTYGRKDANWSEVTSGSGVAWGSISGTLSDQTDLENALDLKANSEDLSAVATSGNYDDLTNKPTIPAAQIQSDWAQTTATGLDFIKNKPTLGTMAAEAASDYTKTSGLAAVATTGSYDDLSDKPTIPNGNYSTTEADTNNKWIDGKSIYRIVLSGNITCAANAVLTVILVNSDVDKLINYSVFMQNGSSSNFFSMDGNYSAGTTTVSGKIFCSDDNKIQMYTFSAFERDGTVNSGYYGFVEYTKI